MEENILKKIKRDIKISYKDELNPDYFFVNQRYEENKYKKIIENLSKNFDIEETTDLNYDVSICLTLNYNSTSLYLQLSLIGAYAILMRYDHKGKLELITSETKQKSNEISIILNILKDNKINCLNYKTLERKIRFKRLNVESKQSNIYQVLFSDEDFLPGV